MSDTHPSVEEILDILVSRRLTIYRDVKDGKLSADNGFRITEQDKREAIAAINDLRRADQLALLDSLYWMYKQYCDDKYGHRFMSAGETASMHLEEAGYITVDDTGVILKDNGDSRAQRLNGTGEK